MKSALTLQGVLLAMVREVADLEMLQGTWSPSLPFPRSPLPVQIGRTFLPPVQIGRTSLLHPVGIGRASLPRPV